MAEIKKSFPRLPITHWWALRRKFKQSIPGVVTDNYLATVLDMKVDSARANVLPFLRQLGIIDEEGKTGARALRWRDDEQYPDVCKEMLTEVYPDELLQAVPGPSADRGKAERWFANHTGTGEGAASQMASLYAVLVEADASKQPDPEKKGAQKTSEDRSRREPRVVARPVEREPRVVARPVEREIREAVSDHRDGEPRRERQAAPGININLQVHISADATPDQIDQIFASMAKHIYPRG